MRRVHLAALLVPVLVIVPRSALGGAKPAAAPSPPTTEELRSAVLEVFPPRYGWFETTGGFGAALSTLENPGPDIVPVLAELVPWRSASLMPYAAAEGAKHSLSVELRAVLRTHRDDEDVDRDRYAAVEDLLRYFAKFGDETDLAWMEKVVQKLPEADRKLGAERVRELRARLATN